MDVSPSALSSSSSHQRDQWLFSQPRLQSGDVGTDGSVEKSVRARRGTSLILCQRDSAGGLRPLSNTHSPPFTLISGRALITEFPADCPNRPSCVRRRLFWTRTGITARDGRHFQLPRQHFRRSHVRPPVPLCADCQNGGFCVRISLPGLLIFSQGPQMDRPGTPMTP